MLNLGGDSSRMSGDDGGENIMFWPTMTRDTILPQWIHLNSHLPSTKMQFNVVMDNVNFIT